MQAGANPLIRNINRSTPDQHAESHRKGLLGIVNMFSEPAAKAMRSVDNRLMKFRYGK